MSETLSSLLFFIFVVTALLAQLADAWYTETGLKKGLVEGNPWNKFLISKVGVPAATFIGFSIFLVLSTIMLKLSPIAGIATAVGATALETVMTLRNKKLVSK